MAMPNSDRRIKLMPRKASSYIEYSPWSAMIQRCLNPSCRAYPQYGGRGITVCDRWRNSFEDFLADIGPRPGMDYSIDRIDVNGNYEPGNCRWATSKTQNRNRRNNRLIEIDGNSGCSSEWAEKTGLKEATITQRINRGWPVEKAIELDSGRKQHHKKLITFNSETMGLVQWAKKLGMPKTTLATRLARGWEIERALTP